MSWEVATFLSVFMICATATFSIWAIFVKKEPMQVSADEFEMLKTAVGMVKADNESMTKLAEETKKLLSQQNLGLSLRGQR